LLLLAGCSGGDEFQRAATLGFEPPRVMDGAVPHVAMARTGGGRVLTVYIEGDGRAWSPGAPPDNPTPRTPVGLELALADPGAPLLYLGRPCQFIAFRADACPPRLWTSGRFSAQVIDAMDAAVVDAERRSGIQALVLVGFSGGAAVAALLALRHPETALLVTVAGVVDHAAWTRLHGVGPLADSLNPADRLDALARIPQVHLAGSADAVVPPVLAATLVARYPNGSAAVTETTPDHHDCCWQEGWAARIEALRERVR
jgi:pimeloyl-ACP methyl ester carboxylesterase